MNTQKECEWGKELPQPKKNKHKVGTRRPYIRKQSQQDTNTHNLRKSSELEGICIRVKMIQNYHTIVEK